MFSFPATTRNFAVQNSANKGSTPAEVDSWLGRLKSRFRRRSRMVAALAVSIGFGLRLWLAQATFFNSDEAWHFSLANQDSAWLAYKASLTIAHPPLLILILHFWRVLGTSNLILRLPEVIAGTVFCWIFFEWLDLVAGRAAAWAGLILATFLGPMISTSAEVRQNPLLLMFSVAAAYFLELALSGCSAPLMCVSSACLYFAMLSHYSAFFVAGALGVYAIVRIWAKRPSTPVILAWLAGEAVGAAVAGFLFKTHLGRLNSLLNQALLPQEYLFSSYFHKGTDHLLSFLYHGTLGVFRFIFGQTQIGRLAAVLFAAGLALLFWGKESQAGRSRTPALGILLLLPFVLSWLAAAAGLYPYGRMRQCMFLAMFALAGISAGLSRIVKERAIVAAAAALGIVVVCQAVGTRQDREALPLAAQRHENMDQAVQFIRSHVTPADLILTDKTTSFQLVHYLCRRRPVLPVSSAEEMETYHCDGLHIISTGPGSGILTAEKVAARWQGGAQSEGLDSTSHVWVVQAGWSSGLGERLREQFPAFGQLEVHSFGRYIEAFLLPEEARGASLPQQR